MSAGARVTMRASAAEASRDAFAEDVRFYLQQSPRQLPSRYLYDALGSALFDAICQLPWYPLTRSESGLLQAHALDIVQRLQPLRRIVELGAGSGDKLARLIQPAAGLLSPLDVHLIDVSLAALHTAARAVNSFASARIVLHQAPYEIGLRQLTNEPAPSGRSLFLFLGSNIGNFDPPGAEALLRQIRAALRPGDGLLVGADLVKPEADLLLAYDDPLEVTAAFNRNLLVRINRELDGDFDLAGFGHRAVWNRGESRIEMHLVSTREQHIVVTAADVDITLTAGETIWTESSYKYDVDMLRWLLEDSGFRIDQQWIDHDAHFALTLLERDEGSQ
jgi:L-histidine N-alpha-methyltransferase